jgi:predicted Holliday junction resolvase-like endonuclease
MAWVLVFAVGVILGVGLTFLILRQTQPQAAAQAQREEILALQQSHQMALTDLIQAHEAMVADLKVKHQQEISQAKQRSVDTSRRVIKGQISEQIAPYLPNFRYLPSDARFIGDPIDFLVINGYTNLKDGQGSPDALEVVLIDIKSGKAKLSDRQEAIARSVAAGRVRFETIRINLDQLAPAPTLMAESPIPLPDPLRDEPEDPHEPEPLPQHSSVQRAQEIAKIREKYPRAYDPWEEQEDFQLGARFQQGYTLEQLAQQFQRQPSAIRSRLQKLKLLSTH